MAIPLVDLKAQYRSIKDDVDAAVARILENASFILGPEVAAFEEAFAAYCQTDYAIGISSGTAALSLSLMALGVGPGDEVITPSMTFIATSAAIIHTGAKPVLVDIDPKTYNLDPSLIEAAITSRTKAIMPVHLYGQPANMTAINQIAQKHGLYVIEDACQAHGATHKGKRAGSLGDIGCFSFYPSKNLGAAGDGGMVTTSNPEIADRIRKLRDHGRTDHYGHCTIGFTYRLDALQAAVLGVKLAHLDDWCAARRQRAQVYSEMLADANVVTPYESPDCESVYHIYAVQVDERQSVLQKLRARGIGASVHYPIPVHLQPACADMNLQQSELPHTESLAQRTLSLPIYPELTPDQARTVVEELRRIVG